QHDFEGRPVFQHRNTDKWDLFPTNKRVEGFVHEVECLGYLEQLRRVWDGRINEVDGWRSKDWLTASSRVALSPGSPRIVAVMVTCSERDAVRRHTLNNLRMTDWGGAPVWVQMDASRSHQRVERIVQHARAALTRGARVEAD